MKNILIGFCALIIFIISCSDKHKDVINDADLIHANVNKLTEIIIYDIFNPPVASRIYAYTSLAMYEAIRYSDPGNNPSIAEKLNGFGPMPQPDKNQVYNYTLAATKAFSSVALKIRIYSDTVLRRYEDSVESEFKSFIPKDVYDRSLTFGIKIAEAILIRASKDQYKETRGMSKYLGTDANGKWQPTPPDYFDGTEPYFKMIYPMTLDSASQFRPYAPLTYNNDSTSGFYKMVKDVYDVNLQLTDSQKTIAKYWDDNPFVVEHSGHLMFANKKITPGGHWMGIAQIACKNQSKSAITSAKAYTLTSIALLDAFISCWEAKFYYEYVRPITLINAWIDRDWNSFLQTPPFPEYTSGHSTISGSSAEVLTALFGDGFAFHDNSDSAYIGMTRDFTSFRQAAEEASLSRLYGGIHYRASLDTGLARGVMIGKNFLRKIGMSN